MRAARTATADTIAEIEAGIAERRDRQDELDREHETLGTEIAELDALAARLRAAIDPHLIGADPSVTSVEPDGSWRRMTRAEAILRLLRESDPMGPTEIAAELRARGRDGEDNSRVASCLRKMQLRGEPLRHLAFGAWTIADESSVPDNVIPFHRPGA
jgi:hypothetical protein